MDRKTGSVGELSPKPDNEFGKLPECPEFQQIHATVKSNRALRKITVILVGAILVAGLLACRYYLLDVRREPPASPPSIQHVSWETYTSDAEKASFHYPSSWKVTAPNQGSLNSDQLGLTSPSGAIKISWASALGGYGNEYGKDYPLHTVVAKNPIAGAPGLYVISGITTLDGSTFHPWLAVQDSQGILSDGVKGDVLAFRGRHAINPTTDDFSNVIFATSGLRADQDTPSLIKTQAIAWFSGAEAQQAKTIMLSLKDAANPAEDWYLYVSPGNHYSVRLPDGWSLVQNGNDPWSELETYYTGFNYQNTEPLAIKTGTKATVAHESFGKDGNPLISFQWYDFANPGQDAQTLLNSFSTDKNLQQEPPFQTDGGQTVAKYYMQVTTPPQNIDQPEVGIYYEYIIKNSSSFVWVFNFYPPGAVDSHENVEAALKTLRLNN